MESIMNTKYEFGGFIPYDFTTDSMGGSQTHVALPYNTFVEEIEFYFLPNNDVSSLGPVNYRLCFFNNSHITINPKLVISDHDAKLEFYHQNNRERLGTFEIGQNIIPNNEKEFKGGQIRFIMSVSFSQQPSFKPHVGTNQSLSVNNSIISLIRYARIYLRSESELREAYSAAKMLATSVGDEYTSSLLNSNSVLSCLSVLSEDNYCPAFQIEAFMSQQAADATLTGSIKSTTPPPSDSPLLSSAPTGTKRNTGGSAGTRSILSALGNLSLRDDEAATSGDQLHPPLSQQPATSPNKGRASLKFDLNKARKFLPPTFNFIKPQLQLYIINKLNNNTLRFHQLTFEICKALSYANSVQGFRAAQAVIDLLSHDTRVQFTNIDAVIVFILQNEISSWGRLKSAQHDFSKLDLHAMCNVSEMREAGVKMSWISVATMSDAECEKLQLILQRALADTKQLNPTFSLSLRKAARTIVSDIVRSEIQKTKG